MSGRSGPGGPSLSPVHWAPLGVLEPQLAWRELRNEATEPGRRSSEGIPSTFLATFLCVAADPNACAPQLATLCSEL